MRVGCRSTNNLSDKHGDATSALGLAVKDECVRKWTFCKNSVLGMHNHLLDYHFGVFREQYCQPGKFFMNWKVLPWRNLHNTILYRITKVLCRQSSPHEIRLQKCKYFSSLYIFFFAQWQGNNKNADVKRFRKICTRYR